MTLVVRDLAFLGTFLDQAFLPAVERERERQSEREGTGYSLRFILHHNSKIVILLLQLLCDCCVDTICLVTSPSAMVSKRDFRRVLRNLVLLKAPKASW